MRAKSTKLFIVLSGLIILGLLVGGCAPAAEPTPTPVPPTPTTAPAPTVAPTKAPEPTPTTAPVAKPTPTTPAPKPAPTPSPPPKPKVEEPKYGGILPYPNQADPPSFDIHQESTAYVLDPVAPMYNGVLQYDPLENDKIVGDLAHKWEVSTDGKVWTFYLHEGVKWHDGQSFTSEDVKYNLERWHSPPEGVSIPKLQPITFGLDKIETPDDNTVEIHFEYAKAGFLPYIAIGFAVIEPKHVLEEKGQDYLKTHVVGTGPYKFESYTKGVSVKMVKNPDYFIEGRPYLDGIDVYIIPDPSTQLAAFRTKQILMTSTYPTLTGTEVDIIKRDMPDAILQEMPWRGFYYMGWRLDKPPWNDIRVRKAIHLLVNRQESIQVCREGQGYVGSFMHPLAGFGHSQEEILTWPGYRPEKEADIAEAKKLMAEAGYADGFKMKLTTRKTSAFERVTVYLKAELAKLGIDATIEIQETARWYETLDTRTFETFVTGLGMTIPDPDEIYGTNYISTGGRNYSGWKNEKFDELFELQSGTLDEAKRKEMSREMEKIMEEDYAVHMVHWAWGIQAHWPELKNFVTGTGLYNHHRYQDLWLAK